MRNYLSDNSQIGEKIFILSNCKTYRAGGFTARASFGESKFFRHLFWRAKCAEFQAEKFSRLCACPQIQLCESGLWKRKPRRFISRRRKFKSRESEPRQ